VLLDRERAVAQVREQRRRERVVVVDRVALGQPEVGPPQLVGMVQLAARA